MEGRDFDAAALQNYLKWGSGPFGTNGLVGGAMFTSSFAARPEWADIYALLWPASVHPKFALELEVYQSPKVLGRSLWKV
ncbi:unnamed protein product [Allacma fusca]|uniref:Uncharacterized protein n=1 Tax=Allacma fusca TaxID=39272 RepID=A0A8J2L1S7_9HEXA|nr:unnamed protein product [Allacma fusca]